MEPTKTVNRRVLHISVSKSLIFLGDNVPGKQTDECNLFFSVMEALVVFTETHPVNSDQMLDDNLKLAAFSYIKKNVNSSISEIVTKVYKLDQSPHLFQPFIDGLLIYNNYVAACDFSFRLRLFDLSGLHKFILPCVFLPEQTANLFHLLNAAPHLQLPLLTELDNLLLDCTEQNCQDMIEWAEFLLELQYATILTIFVCRKYNYKNLPQENFTFEFVKSKMSRLRKRFSLPMELMPNFDSMRQINALKFMIHKYEEGGMCEYREGVVV